MKGSLKMILAIKAERIPVEAFAYFTPVRWGSCRWQLRREALLRAKLLSN